MDSYQFSADLDADMGFGRTLEVDGTEWTRKRIFAWEGPCDHHSGTNRNDEIRSQLVVFLDTR
jgi:hypothetical protein